MGYRPTIIHRVSWCRFFLHLQHHLEYSTINQSRACMFACKAADNRGDCIMISGRHLMHFSRSPFYENTVEIAAFV